MQKIIESSRTVKLFLLFFTVICLLSISAPAFSVEGPVAKLTKFSGTVLIKSQGSWGIKPEKDLPLYSEDKLVTRTGVATITFNDGAVMEIKPNSNLLIKESEEEAGIGETIRGAKRRLRLLLGKMFFRTGRSSKTKTTLETTTMVCGLRGTAGVISMDAAGQTYLQFTEGSGDTVGNFISGVASDVPSELANLNPAQRASFVAAAAADQAANAAEMAATGEMSDADAALAASQAAKAAAQEAKDAAEAMLNSPDAAVQAEAQAAIIAAEQAIDAAEAAEAAATEAGATAPATTAPTTGATGTGDTQTGGEIGFDILNHESVEDVPVEPPYIPPENEAPLLVLNAYAEGSMLMIDIFTEPAGGPFSYILYGSDGTTVLMEGHSHVLPETGVAESVTLSGISENTEYTLEVVALDDMGAPAGEPRIETFTAEILGAIPGGGMIIGQGSEITGTTGDTSITSVDSSSGINWGGYSTPMMGEWTGTHTGNLSMHAGGGYYDGGGYTYSTMSGSLDPVTGAASALSEFTALSPFNLTTGTGSFTGTFASDNTWSGIETGSILTDDPLTFASPFSSCIWRGTLYVEGRYYYTGSAYAYYSYEYNTDNSYGYTYYYQDDPYMYTYTYYYQDGTTSTYTNDGSVGSSTNGTWDPLTYNLSSLATPPPEYGTNYYLAYEYDDEVSSSDVGCLEGLIGGTGTLWSSEGSPVTSLGYLEDFGSGSIFLNHTYSQNYNTGYHTTYDGGAFFTILGGIKNGNQLEGRWIGIGMSPDGTAGYVRGNNLTGETTDNNMYKMTGDLTWEPREPIAGVSPDVLIDNNIYGYINSYGSMTLGGKLGNNGVIGYGGYYYDSGDFTTASIVDTANQVAQPWGIYGGWAVGHFENPDNATSFTSHSGGEGSFGDYFNANNSVYDDYGNWVGETHSSWTGGVLSADFTGRFITETKMGTMEGEVLGTYTGTEEGTWEAINLGTWEGEPLAFGNDLYGDIRHAVQYNSGYYAYSGGGHYQYYYHSDNSYGYTYHYPESSSYP